MRIAQLSFLTLTTPAEHPYGSGRLGCKYQGQAEPTPSRYHLNFEPATVKVLVTGGDRVRRRGGRPTARGRRPRGAARSRARTGGDVTDPAVVDDARMDGVDAVVHLVAILDGSPEQFESREREGARNVVAAAEAAGVRRFLHMSALGVTEEHAPLTGYWGTKWTAKQAVIASDLDWTVFEPSFVFSQRRRRVRRVRAPDAAAGRAGDRRRPLPPPAGVAGRRRGRVLARARAARDGRQASTARRAAGLHVRRAAGRDRARHRPAHPPEAARAGGLHAASRRSSSCAGCRRRCG